MRLPQLLQHRDSHVLVARAVCDPRRHLLYPRLSRSGTALLGRRHLAHGGRSLPAVLRPVPSGRDGDRWFGGRRSQPVVASLESGTFVRVGLLRRFFALGPQFLYQLDNTGAPWAPRPSLLDFFGDSFNALASAAWAAIVVAIAVAVLWRRRPDLVSGGHQSATSSSLSLATAVALITLLLAWGAAQFVNSWNPRYLGIAMVPALVPLAGALGRARFGTLVLWAAVVAMACTALPVVVDRSVTVQTSKSDAAYLLDHLKPVLRPGALVISTEVTDAPVLAVDLGSKFRYATPFGLLKDPLVVDWSDMSTRLQRTDAASNLGPLLATMPVGGQVLVVNPTTWGGGETPENYAGPVEAEAIAANQTVLNDPQLQPEITEVVPKYSDPLYPMEASLFVKTSSGGLANRSGEGGI